MLVVSASPTAPELPELLERPWAANGSLLGSRATAGASGAGERAPSRSSRQPAWPPSNATRASGLSVENVENVRRLNTGLADSPRISIELGLGSFLCSPLLGNPGMGPLCRGFFARLCLLRGGSPEIEGSDAHAELKPCHFQGGLAPSVAHCEALSPCAGDPGRRIRRLGAGVPRPCASSARSGANARAERQAVRPLVV